MSYQVLARKWRPKNFSEMVGQEHVLRALINALDNDRLHHAFLFTGTRGVGKTTIGRILAKSLNCEEGISSTPCGVCSACQEIDEGRFIDLLEVDAASRTKVEDTRELLENVQYAPTRGRFKVYLIDEVHMLSNHSFNALLKTLEEPPPHVKFLLATTDPQKLPATILSRCLQFNLKRMPLKLIADHMQFILGQEKVEFDNKAVHAIASAADGSMRDALSLLDQSIAHGGGQVKSSEVHDMLGTIEHHHVENLLRALISNDAARVLDEINELAEKSPDFMVILTDILSMLHRIAIAQMVPNAIDDSQGDKDLVLELATIIPAEDVQLYYQIGLIGKRDLPLAPDMQSGFEMVMLRLLAFKPYDAPASVPKTPKASTQSSVETVSQPSQQVQKKAVEEITPKIESTPAGNNYGSSEWGQIVDALGLKAIAKELAAHSVLSERDGNTFRLVLDPSFEQLCTDSARKRLEQALSAHFNETMTVDMKISKPELESPAEHKQRAIQEKQDHAVDTIKQDPFVQELQDTLNADINAAVIEPTE
ncbi:MAG: DNA polymerase III subunit gamma/tau [Gammaproteobacteria bacterium]|nr:DNA polymerase III subunit gamma/tau [Gammaproteobacteria bacterium]